MADNDELQILATVALDLAKSLTQIQAQMKTLQAQMQGYTIKLTAGLDKAASRAKINADAKSLKASNVKLTGQLDTTATRREIKAGISKIKEQQIKLQGVLDRAATTRNLKEQLKTIPTVQATASVRADGAEQIEKLRQNMDAAKNSAVDLAAKTYLVRTALQALRQTAEEVIDNIAELDAAATNLAIITGGRSAETYELLEQYNTLARDLGATTTQVSSAAAAWLRQGKNAAETAELIEQSIMLSKVAMIDSETATKNLTSAMRGYGMAVEDVTGIVDKLAALDSKAAVTASDLAVAMSQTASSANIGGVSMDRLLGYLAAVQETTQRSAETIGQSFKTIFARMGNIKLGKFFDDEGNDLSDVESSLTHYGIALRNAEGDFRNFGDVLDEVYGKWEQFRAVDQRAIAQAFAGTRQQENFLVLMQNYGKALEYAGISADSAGTALQKFGAYQESIEAKAAGFSAALESLTMDTFDPELVKDLIDTATVLVDLTEKAGILRAALISLGAAGTMKGVQTLATGFVDIKQNVLNLGESVNVLRKLGDVSALTGADISRLGELTKGLNNEQLKVVLTTQNLTTAQRTAILTASGLTAEEAAQKLEALGLATAEETATGATLSLSNAMQGLGASIKAAFAANPIGMVSLSIGAAITVFSLLNSAVEKVEQAEQEARTAAREGAEAYSDNAAAADNYKKRLYELRAELDRGNLSEKDAYDKRAKLVEIEQALIDKFGKEAEGIHLVTGEINEQAAAIDRLSESEYNEWRRTNPDAIQDAIKLFTDFSPTDLDWFGDTKGINVYPVSSGDLQKAIKDLDLDIAPRDFHDALQRAIEEAGLEIEIPIAGITGDFVSDTDLKDIRDYIDYYSALSDITEDLGKEYFGGKYLDYVGDALSKYAAEINSFENAAKENIDTFNTYAEGQLRYGAEYAVVWREVSAAQQDYHTAVLNGDNDAVSAAITRMREARDAFLAAGWDNEAVNRYAEDFFEKFEAQAADGQAEMFRAIGTAAGDAASSVSALGEQINSLSKLSDSLSKLDKMGETLHKLAQDGVEVIPLDVLSDFLDLIPEAAGEITTVSEAQEKLKEKISETERVARDTYAQMLITNDDYISDVISGNENLLIALQRCYGTDKTRFQQLADGKLQIEQALISELSGLWLRYSKYTTDQLEQQLHYLDYVDASPNMERINELKAIIALRRALEDNLNDMVGGRNGGGGSGSGKSSKSVDRYIAEIDRFREAQRRLTETEERAAKIEAQIDRTDDLKEQIALQRQLADAYADRQGALHGLNDERRKAIAEGVDKLTDLGFEVSYDPATNELLIENLEHLNELATTDLTKYETMADMSVNVVGKYDNVTDATNGLIKDTEGIIKNITEFNDANKENSEEWWELADSIHETKTRVGELLDEIVSKASEAVDEIQNVYDTLHEAADTYAASGFITVDALQSIIGLGAKYLKYLMDENDQLVINEDAIRSVIAAKTEEMTVETAMSYIESVRIAHLTKDADMLRDLTHTTMDASGATWELVYANAAILKQQGLADDYYNGMINVIDGLRSLADNAKAHIGDAADSVRDALSNMKTGLDDIIKYTMDMLKQRVNDQIDALNGMKDAYSEIIDKKRESLRADKEAADYSKNLNNKLREQAKLQAKIDALSIAANQGDRKAIAERAKLEEEMAALSEDIADMQADYAVDATEESLGKMEEAYHVEKDKEIKILEDSISSYQKLYDKAIAYISDHWDTLYSELIGWNTQYGSELNDGITSAWDNALAAAQRYGNFVSALGSIDADISATGGSGSSGASGNSSLGNTNYNHTTNNETLARAWVDQMQRNSAAWHTASESGKTRLAEENKRIAEDELSKLGVDAYIENGVWYVRGGKRLYDVYHNGGVVGGGTPSENERLALLKDKEWVLSERMVDTVSTMIERIGKLRSIGGDSTIQTMRMFTDTLRPSTSVSNVTNNSSQPVNINFGDTVINGATPNGVNQYMQLTEDMKKQIARWLGLRM